MHRLYSLHKHTRQSSMSLLCHHTLLSFDDADSSLLPSLLRCGPHPLHPVPTPHLLPLPQARPRRRLLLSVVCRMHRLAAPTSLLRPHCLTRKLPRASLGMARQLLQQVATHLLLHVYILKTRRSQMLCICIDNLGMLSPGKSERSDCHGMTCLPKMCVCYVFVAAVVIPPNMLQKVFV